MWREYLIVKCEQNFHVEKSNLDSEEKKNIEIFN